MSSDSKFVDRLLDLIGNNRFVCDAKDEKWYTYHELWVYAYRLAKGLMKSQSDGFVVIMENSIDLFVLYFAAMLSNKTIIPIDPHKSETEIQMIISKNLGRMVVYDIRDIEEIGTDRSEITDSTIIEAIKNIDFKKDYMITYTSGSTGFPKGVRHNLENLFLSADSFGNAVGLNDTDTMCHVMPMSYMAGILNTIIMPFLRGSKIVILPRFDVMSAVSFWQYTERFKINAFWLSPTMLNILMMVDRKGKGKEYLSTIRSLFFIGTAPLYETIRDKFEEMYGVNLLQSYGLSETLFISTEIPQKKSDTSAVGYVLPEVSLLHDSEGELAVSVPWMFLGYTNDDTEKYFNGDYYFTGDLVQCENGLLSITGRKKDLIIKGGMNISPKQIEDCILRYGGIYECAVAGKTIDDEERIICWYVSDKEKEKSDLNRYVESVLGKHCCIDIFERVSFITKNTNGKPDKKRLVEEFRI